LREQLAEADSSGWLSLTIEDSGPGIPRKALDQIFEAGYSTRSSGSSTSGGWPATHRGLGLSITRSIVEAAGGRIHAAHRAPMGARFEIELPVRTR
jgi:two-component system sensor histidine kinase BaeS